MTVHKCTARSPDKVLLSPVVVHLDLLEHEKFEGSLSKGAMDSCNLIGVCTWSLFSSLTSKATRSLEAAAFSYPLIAMFH